MRISVVIATYNRARFLEGLYRSIIEQTLPSQAYEILFIDNNCTDQTPGMVAFYQKQNPAVRYIKETQQGLSFARNRGIAEAQAPYICFADDDALLDKEYLEKVCDYLDGHPTVYEVGGPIFLKYLGIIPDWESPYLRSLLGYFYPSSQESLLKKKDRKYPRGSNMVFRKAAFDQCGVFATDLGRKGTLLLGGEEKDMAYRLIDKHLDVAYIPEAIVYHLVPSERTTTDYIRHQALGCGAGERHRTRAIKGEYSKRLVQEAVKWAATLILWGKYMIMLKPKKANVLVRFRFWVTKGLITNL